MPAVRESRLLDQRSLFPELDLELYRYLGLPPTGPTESQAHDLWTRCAKDPEFYIFGGFVRTFDSHDRKNPVKTFPSYDYLRDMLRHIHPRDIPDDDTDVAAISKSRQLGLTWLACAYASWEARFHQHSLTMIQSKKAEDAWKLVYKQDWLLGRVGFIERAMVPFLRSRGLVATRGELSYPTGSQVWGIPQGAHMFRGYTARLVICDECCFQDKFKEAYTAALAMASRIVLITTANYGTFYGSLVEEEIQPEAA